MIAVTPLRHRPATRQLAAVLMVLFMAAALVGLSQCGSGAQEAPTEAGVIAARDGSSDGRGDATDAAANDAWISRVPVDAGAPVEPTCATRMGELPGISSEGIAVSAVVTGDFNGDGKTDVAAGGAFELGHGAAGVVIALGNGDGTFAAGTVVETAPGSLYSEPNAAAFATGDFNGDGKTDIVADDPVSDGVTLLLGGSDGGAGAVAAFDAGTTPVGIAVGDMNGDGQLDVVTANQGSLDVSVLLGGGDGGLAAPLDYPAGGAAASVLVADFNGDEKLDVAVLDSPGSGAQIAILLGTGGGALGAPKMTAAPGAIALAMLEWNGDGHPDLTYADATNDAVVVLLGVGDGTFGAPESTALADALGSIAAADVDGDGRPDVVVAGESAMHILRNQGDAGPASPTSVAVVAPAQAFVATDVNGDGRPDFVLAPESAPLSVLLNQGGGGFPAVPFVTYATGPSASAVAAADMNGDGLLDLSVVSMDDAGTVSLLLSTGSGAFAPAVSYGSSASPSAIAAVDLDGDGKNDLVVLGAQQLSVLLNLGDGGLGAATQLGAGGTPSSTAQSMAVGDWNGDGIPDIAVANTFGPDDAIDGNVGMLFGVGDGTFHSAVGFASGIQPGVLGAGDFEGKGVLSLVVGSLTTLSLVTFDVNGNPTPSPIASLPTGASPASIAVADFDSDGKSDLAVGLEGEIDLFSGNGDGTFGTPVVLPLEGMWGFALVAADVDADGLPDLVGTDGWGSVLIVRNHGGTFAKVASYAIGEEPRSLAVGDFDRKGALDLAVANLGASQVSVLLTPCGGDGGT